MNSPCSTTPGTCLTRGPSASRSAIGRAARSPGSSGPRRSGTPRRPRAAAAPRPAAAPPGGAACRAIRSAPPPPAAGSSRPAASTRFDASATTTKRRAAEITIFSRSSAPPPPLISRSDGSTSSAPSSARSSSNVPSSSTTSKPAVPRQLLRARRRHGGAHRLARARPAAPPPSTAPAPSPARSSCRARTSSTAAAAAAARAGVRRRAHPTQLGVHFDRRRPPPAPSRPGSSASCPLATCWNSSSSIPGTVARVSSTIRAIRGPESSSSRWTVAVVSTSGVVAGAAQVGRQRHREAAGVSRRDQLLGIGPVALLEARLERVRPLVGAALHPHRPVALFQGAVPAALAVLCRHLSTSGSWVVRAARYSGGQLFDGRSKLAYES